MKFPTYPRTKPSDVEWLGNVPADWKVKRGRFVMQVNPPAPRLRALELEDEVSFVPMEALGVQGGINLDQTRILGDVVGGYTEFQDGDVIVAKITPCFENGKAALATDLLNGAAYGTTELHVLRAGVAIEQRFLFYIVLSDTFRKLGESEMYGAGGQKRVPPEFNKDFRTPLPPLPEQRAIAAFLERETGRMDVLVGKKRELIERLKEKRAALINAVMSGRLRNESDRDTSRPWRFPLPNGWHRKRLKHLVFMKGRLGWQGLRSDEYTDEGPYLVSSEHFVDDRIDWVQCNHVSEERFKIAPEIILRLDDVLFMKDGAAMGKLAFVDQLPAPACLNSHLLVLRPDQDHCLPRFIYYALKSLAFEGYMIQERTGTTFFGFSQESMGNFELSFPSIHEQQRIVGYLDCHTAKLNSLAANVEEAIERLQEYRTALITAAVTGKVDVRKAAT